MKKMFKVTLTLLFSVFFIVTGNKLNASVLTQTHHDDIWLDSLTVGDYRGMTDKFTEYTIDGKVTYCVEPNVSIKTDTYYGEIGFINSPYSDEINRKLQLIGYYGYGYPGHDTLQYKMATQALLWEVLRPQEFKFWTEANGQGDYIDVSYERNEIMNLVNSHYTLPSFAKETKDISLGETATFIDSTGVLSKYEIDESDGAVSVINGNQLSITPNKVGEINVVLKMKRYTDQPTEFFIADDGVSQKMGRFNIDDPIFFSVWLNVSGVSLELIKKDSDTNLSIPLGDGSLAGAKYELLDTARNHITYLVTNNFGRAKTEKILSTNTTYILREVEASNGYLLDDKEYIVNVGKELEVTIEVKEKVKDKEVNFFKLFANGNTGFLTPEPNITFDFYLKSSGEYYKSLTTDEFGFGSLFLPYGVWVVKQRNATENYEKVDDFEISVTDNVGKITKYLSNAEITAKLKLLKYDTDTNKPIKYAGAKFKIRNIDTGEYVCEKISYPSKKEVCEYLTDENGEFITFYPLESGNYEIIELEPPKGYKLSLDTVKFSVSADGNIIFDKEYGNYIEVKFYNDKILGNITVEKTGEVFKLDNGHFYYDEMELNGVTIDLYAGEDIVTLDGVLHYKKGDLIESLITDSGKVIFDNLFVNFKYVIKESRTLDGYILDEKEYIIELNNVDTFSKNIKIKNYLEKGGLDFSKVSFSDGEPLPNTLIEIYTEDDVLVFSDRTDSKGKVIISNLKVGRYYILEKEAPEGYLINPEKMYFEIRENGEIVKATMTDEKIEIDVPITGVKDSHFIEILGIVLVLCGIGVVLYAKNKKIN